MTEMISHVKKNLLGKMRRRKFELPRKALSKML